jgi:hypothetical protein
VAKYDPDLVVDCSDPVTARLSGGFDPANPADGERALEPVRQALREASSFTLDLSELSSLGSAATASLSRLVLQARAQGAELQVIGCAARPGHEGTLRALKRLYGRLEVRLVAPRGTDSSSGGSASS